jgi:hypothetical protein
VERRRRVARDCGRRGQREVNEGGGGYGGSGREGL